MVAGTFGYVELKAQIRKYPEARRWNQIALDAALQRGRETGVSREQYIELVSLLAELNTTGSEYHKTKQVDLVLDYFRKEDARRSADNTHTRTTDVGVCAPSSLVHLTDGFQQLVEHGLIDNKKYFADAGCGDGRVVALVAAAHRLPSVGVEYDTEIAAEARVHLLELRALGAIDNTPTLIATGDFTLDETYRSAGITFSDIGTFFNYINNQGQIAAKIAHDSPSGTRFLLYSGRPVAEEFAGLTPEKTLELIDNERMIPRIRLRKGREPEHLDPVPHKAHLHVYIKP